LVDEVIRCMLGEDEVDKKNQVYIVNRLAKEERY
jgi:hypothetical protein